MKLPDFNHAKGYRKFDRFGEFYNEVNEQAFWWGYNSAPFVLFETGEFILTQARFKPKRRGEYKHLGVSILASTDYDFAKMLKDRKLLTPDGDEVLPSWLNQKAYQSLWVDHDHNRVVRLGYGRGKEHREAITPRLRSYASLYYASGNDAPVGGGMIEVSRPSKLTKDERAHIDMLRAACKAWDAIAEEAKVPAGVWPSQQYNYNGGKCEVNPYYYSSKPAPVGALLKLEYADMTYAQKKQLLNSGVTHRRDVTTFSHLTIA